MPLLCRIGDSLSLCALLFSEQAESASKAEVETFTQIYPQKEEAVKKHLNDTTSISVEISNETYTATAHSAVQQKTLTFSAVPFTVMPAH